MLRRAGATPRLIRVAMPKVLHAAERHYLRICPDIRHKLCPGVVPVLDRLTRHNALLGLVTGNLTRIGWRKLECAGLRDYFRFGAFGEMAATRGGLAALAISEARRRRWIDWETPISLIGDAPSDVVAARENGIRSIAVRTGVTAVEDLIREKPDILLKNLHELRLRMVETKLEGGSRFANR
jgi:phosphoglycolate phosphatase-like HAD superfamily hydrolase